MVFGEILYHSSWRYCESSGRDTGGEYRFHIKRSQINRNGLIILSLGDYAGAKVDVWLYSGVDQSIIGQVQLHG
ncbi:hypothetical protein TNCV_368221 [Trichonephila clavipes]|nr:hypothetical protein TNCV_368221 [Trichonephila clavipes]